MQKFDDNLIYTYDHAISPLLCKTIIDMFNNEEGRYKGVTAGGYKPEHKKTTDFVIPNDNNKWERINNFLNKELASNVKKYLNNLNCINNFNIITSKYMGNFLQHDTFMIQKYEKNIGKFEYHHDFMCEYEKSRHRMITYILFK
jgi:hypothetical protein